MRAFLTLTWLRDRALCFAALSLVLFACGSEPAGELLPAAGRGFDSGQPSDWGNALLQTPPPSNTSTGGELRDTQISVSNALVTPSNIPPGDSDVREILFSADVTFTVALDRQLQYNRINWGLRFSNPVDPQRSRTFVARKPDNLFSVTADGISPDEDSRVLQDTVSGLMEFRIELAEDEWRLIRDFAGVAEGQKRSRIRVELIYSIRDTITSGDSDGTAIRDATFMQNDVGLIKDAPTVALRGTSSGVVTLEISGPANLNAELPSDNYADIGPSLLSGYLVMYWKDGDCDDATWVFQSNAPFRVDPNVADPTLSCSYPGLDAMLASPGRCPVGCGSEPSAGFFARAGINPTGDDVAVPLNGGACYRTVLLKPGRKSVALTGLEDNQRYGIMVWPVDSAGTPGAGRSSCTDAVPLKVPLASSGDGSPSVRDCFVATAASGDPSSLTVHYWRAIRDRLLDPLGFSAVYYRHAPAMAEWLNSHPQLKPVVNSILLGTGRAILAVDHSLTAGLRWVERQYERIQGEWTKAISATAQSASASVGLFSVQLQGIANGAEDSEQKSGDPVVAPSKALRTQDEATAEAESIQPSKNLGPLIDATDVAPSKALPPKGSLESAGETPSKSLPPLSQVPTDQDAKESSRFPLGSGAATTRFGGGILQPSDTKLWDAFYPSGDPVRIALQQTFRVADFMGEWGLGFSGSLQFHQGKVPATLPGGEGVAGAVAGRKISYYSTGLYFSTDYRFRYMPNPPVTPRFMLSLGGERLRETESVATAQDSSKNDGSERTGKFGYTLLKPMVLAGAALEFSFGALFGKSFQSTALGYGARDVMLGVDALMSFDMSDHKFTQNGLLLGGSIVLLLE